MSSSKRVLASQGGPRVLPLLASHAKSKRVADISSPEGAPRDVNASNPSEEGARRDDDRQGMDTATPLKKRALDDGVHPQPDKKSKPPEGTSRQRGTGRKHKGRKECAALKEVKEAMAKVLKVARSAEKNERPLVTPNPPAPAPHTFGTPPPSPASNVHINVYVSPRQL